MPTGRCRCCACPRRKTISPPSARPPAASMRERPTSSSSAPVGRAWADRPWRSLPVMPFRASARCAKDRGCISRQSRSAKPSPACSRFCRSPRPRFVAISKSGGTAETLMQTAAALSAVKQAGLAARIADIFLGLSEPAVAGKRNGLRDLLAAHGVSMLDHDHQRRRPLLGADQCRPAAGGGGRSRRRGDARRRGGGAGAGARRQAAGRGAGGGRRRARGRAGRHRARASRC